jgi:hypothetical protein
MCVDRALPLERAPRARDVVRLRNPGDALPMPRTMAVPAAAEAARAAAAPNGALAEHDAHAPGAPQR